MADSNKNREESSKYADRETVGKLSSELLIKSAQPIDPIEQGRVMTEDYLDNLLECCNTYKKTTTDNFYMVVITKKEPLMPNVLRNYFFARRSCPTPDYDQAVYKYDARDETIEFLWVIPSKWTCLYLREHAKEVVAEEWSLLSYVLKFANGELWNLAKQLNNEQKDSPVLMDS